MTTTDMTPRERLEEEVRITAQRPKFIFYDDSKGTEHKIKLIPLQFDSTEEALGRISKLIRSIMNLATRSDALGQKMQETARIMASKSVADSSVGDSGASDVIDFGDKEGDAVPAEAVMELLEELLNPTQVVEIAQIAIGIIKDIIEIGSDADFKIFEGEPLVAVLSVTVQVILFNVGPELQSFLSKEVTQIKPMFVDQKTGTEERPSLSVQDIESKLSEPGPLANSSVEAKPSNSSSP